MDSQSIKKGAKSPRTAKPAKAHAARVAKQTAAAHKGKGK